MPQPTTGRKKLARYDDDRPAIEEARSLPFPEWAERFLRIRDENGVLVPFTLRETQRRFDAFLEEELAEKGYARVVVLKARKEGISSVVQGRAVREAIERPGWHVGVMAHNDDACAAIFERTRTFFEGLPQEMQRSLERWNLNEIATKAPHASNVEVNVAKGRGAWARGSDKHYVHLSEFAFWPLVRGEARSQGQLVAIMNAVPRVPGTVVVIESTANGAGNHFHHLWKRTAKKGSDWRPLFFAWQDFPIYRIEGKKASDFHADLEWEKDEPRLRGMGIDEEQLAWRRWKIAADCDGDLDVFNQEFPATESDAFLATGTPVFLLAPLRDREAILRRREDPEKGCPTPRYSFNDKGQIAADQKSGEVRFWRTEGAGELDLSDPDRYVITADPAGSGAHAPDAMKGDPACAYVWDRTRNEQISEMHGWLPPDEFGQALAWLGAIYQNPLIIPEAGPWGGHVVSVLQRLNYPRIYFRERLDDQFQMPPVNYGQYGWVTSAKTKPQMIDALRQLWRDGAIVVQSLECVAEHLTFVKNGIRREAASGCHDDRVMACAIFALWSLQHPYAPKPKVAERPRPTFGLIMRDILEEERKAEEKSRWKMW